MRWQHGQDRVEDLISRGRLQRCDASLDDARGLLADGRHFLELLASPESVSADLRHRLAFRAMASSASALLMAQGLRPSRVGGIDALWNAIDAQFGGGPAGGVFDRLLDLSAPLQGAAGSKATSTGDEELAADTAVQFVARLLDTNLLRPFTLVEPSVLR